MDWPQHMRQRGLRTTQLANRRSVFEARGGPRASPQCAAASSQGTDRYTLGDVGPNLKCHTGSPKLDSVKMSTKEQKVVNELFASLGCSTLKIPTLSIVSGS